MTTVLRTLSFPPPGNLLSMNDRGAWQRQHRLRKVWADAVYWRAVQIPRLPAITVPVTIDIALPVRTRHKRDPMNLVATAKVIIDALCEPRGSRKVGAGWLVDDDAAHVTVLEPTLVYGGDLVTVTIRAREERVA